MRLHDALLIALPVAFLDDFPFVVGLLALGQREFDLGPAAAMSIIYFLIILLLSWIFYTVMTSSDEQA